MIRSQYDKRELRESGDTIKYAVENSDEVSVALGNWSDGKISKAKFFLIVGGFITTVSLFAAALK